MQDLTETTPEVEVKSKCKSHIAHWIIGPILFIIIAVLVIALIWTNMESDEANDPNLITADDLMLVEADEPETTTDATILYDVSGTITSDDVDPGVTNLWQEVTYLSSMDKEPFDNCYDLNYHPDLERAYGGIDLADVETEIFNDLITEFAPANIDIDILIAALVETSESTYYSDLYLSRICKDDDELFFAFTTSNFGLVIGDYAPGKAYGSIRYYNQISSMMDFAFTFYPRALNGEHLVGTGYGDAGHSWWSYYQMDEATYHPDLIEICAGSYDNNAERVADDVYDYTCHRQYVPAE